MSCLKRTVSVICSLVIRTLLYMYTCQSLCVKWNSAHSCSFNVTNGVKQGGILSPILYCVYTDDLLLKLKDLGIGCCIGPYFYGALAYADDIVLLCPSVRGAQSMLDLCNEYATQFNILFNATKSQVLVTDKVKVLYN